MKKQYRNRERTKKKIKESLVELIGEKRNISEITVTELANRAEIAKSTFYNHYDDIWSVVQEFEDELLNQLTPILNMIEFHSIPEYELAFLHVIDFLKSHETVYRTVVASPDVRIFIEKLKTILAKKFFEVFPTLQLNEKTKPLFLDIEVLKVATNSERDYLHVHISSTHLIQKRMIHSVEMAIKEQLFADPYCRVLSVIRTIYTRKSDEGIL